MLHNSTFRRALLAEMNKNPLVLRAAGRASQRRAGPGATAGAGQLDLIASPGPSARRATFPPNARRPEDAADFLNRLDVTIDPAAKNQVDPGGRLGGTRASAASSRMGGSRFTLKTVRHCGPDGFTWKTRCVRRAGRSCSRGEIRREPRGRRRIAPPTWGANYAVPDLVSEYLGDDTFRSLAHAGADGMFVYGEFLLYAAGTRFAELNHPDAREEPRDASRGERARGGVRRDTLLRRRQPQAARRPRAVQTVARRRGAQLSFHPTAPASRCTASVSSSDERAGFHADVFARMFRECRSWAD
jgi:hypothetical protein